MSSFEQMVKNFVEAVQTAERAAYQAGRQAGHAEGYQEGVKEGHAQAMAWINRSVDRAFAPDQPR